MRNQSFYINKTTKSIEDTITGKSYETEVVSTVSADLRNVAKKGLVVYMENRV